MPTLPDLPFAEIALRLMHLANEAARACADGEIILARAGMAEDERLYPGSTAWIREKRVSAVMAGQVLQFFKEMAPYEDQFRDFVAGLEAMASRGDARKVGGAG